MPKFFREYLESLSESQAERLWEYVDSTGNLNLVIQDVLNQLLVEE